MENHQGHPQNRPKRGGAVSAPGQGQNGKGEGEFCGSIGAARRPGPESDQKMLQTEKGGIKKG